MPNNMIDRALLRGFADEVRDYVPQVREALETLLADPSRLDVLEEAHRLAHSVKGAASMVGLPALSHVAWMEESLIEELAGRALEWNSHTAHILSNGIASMHQYLEQVLAGSPEARKTLERVLTSFRRLRHEPEAGDAAAIEALMGSGEEQAEPPAQVAPPQRLERMETEDVNDVQLDLLDTFRQEADEILHNTGTLLRQFGQDARSLETVLADVRRHVHTLKGAAASVGVRPVAQLSHRMEDLLDLLREGEVEYSDEIRALLFATFDCLTDLASGSAESASPEQLSQLYARYAAILPASAPRTPPSPLSEPSVDLIDAFRMEAEENLRAVGTLLRSVERTPESREPFREVRRIIHTVKGAANMVGLGEAAGLAHGLEDLLERAAAAEGPVTGTELAPLFEMTDVLGDLLSGAILNGAPSTEQKTAGLGEEQAFDVPGGAGAGEAVALPAKASQYVRIPIERLDALVRLVSELVVNRSTFEQHLAAYSREVGELGLSVDRLRRVAGGLDSGFEVGSFQGNFGQLSVRAVGGAASDKRADFDALEFDRYTNVHLLARDLAETSSDIGSAAGELSHRISDFDSYLNRLSLLTGDLQDRLMRLRMVPMASLATRLHRTVRTTAEKNGKHVELVLEGENVELDKSVIEEIAGPLEHLLRNAVDHGIESESLRRIIGKNPRGQITVSARNEGTQVVLRVRDDGAGMDAETLRSAAVRLGIVTAERAAAMDDADLCDLIFEPGFTTSRTVSETSGRGVGMDVVRTAVRKLEGTLRVETDTGSGTVFTIRLPMTLAILRVLLVKACGETFAVPLGVVSQIRRIEPKQLERIGNRTVLRIDGGVIPAAHLGEVLDLKAPQDQSVRRLPVMVLDLAEQKLAIAVDQLVEAREVVVKNLGATLRKAPFVSGATLMGDGSVVLILNPSELLPGVESAGPGNRLTRAAPVQTRRALEVMVVDDSVSVRRVLTNLVRNHGWNPTAARDGQEALEMLQRGYTPDVILLDIEMPRMDGYELTSSIRSTPTLRELPIVMLTSRSGEKHRKKAFDLGVTDYLVKPYQEETLIAVVRRVVRESREAVAG